MNKIKVIGVVRSSGNSKDRQTGNPFSWDNIILNCEVSEDNPDPNSNFARITLAGCDVEVYKMKNDFSNVIVRDFPVNRFSDLLGCLIRVFYDQYKNVSCIEVIGID